MALNETATFTSPVKLGSTDVAIIFGTGTPDGASSPQSDALKGTLYIRTDQADDLSPLYLKVDEGGADDDWVLVVVANDEGTITLENTLTMDADQKVQFRDTGLFIHSSADGYLKITSDVGTYLGGGTNRLMVDDGGELTLQGTARVNSRAAFEIFDDFIEQTLTEVNGPWIENAGADPQAVDAVINVQEGGVARLVTGDNDGSTAQDASQLVCHIPVQADSGGLVFECRLNIDTAITNVAINAGLTDSTALEEPFNIGGGDAITSTATDAVCFCYDTDADTDEWFMLAVDSDADDTGNAATGTAPVADTFQVLRIEVEADGNTVRYYINGTLEGTLTNAGVTANTNLYATVIACGDSTASKTVDVDYIYVGHTR